MMKFSTLIFFFVLIISCRKDGKQPQYDEQFSISFTLDGHQYDTTLPFDQMNMYTAWSVSNNTAVTAWKLGPILKLGGNAQISFLFANYHYINNDNTGNLARLKSMLRPGQKNFKCIDMLCDTSLAEAVQISFNDNSQSSINWSTTKRTSIPGMPGSVSFDVNQPGSHFTVTEIKESNTIGNKKNAVIIKGTFECILYEAGTGNSKLLKDGRFTVLIPTLYNN